MPRFLGESISDAINWTQDKLKSTRPLAETVLFSLLKDKIAKETEQGFVLFEDDDEEIIRRRVTHMKHRPRFRFAHKRKTHSDRKNMQHERMEKVAKAESDKADDLLLDVPLPNPEGLKPNLITDDEDC